MIRERAHGPAPRAGAGRGKYHHDHQSPEPGRPVRAGRRHRSRSAGPGGRGGPPHLPRARSTGQPVRPCPRRPGHPRGRPRRDPGPQLCRVGGGHGRLLQGPDRAGQPELPVRGPRAAVRDRQRRSGRPGLRAGPVAAGGGVPGAGRHRCRPRRGGRGRSGDRARVARGGGGRDGHLGGGRARGGGLRGGAVGGLPRARLRSPLPRRPLPALHRWHHRHAQGRDVAAGGHLLRRHGRWRLGSGADHGRRPAGWPPAARRRRPGRDADRRTADARECPVGDVERLHDGRHRGRLHQPPLRSPRALADRQRRGRGLGGPGGRCHGPADGRGAGQRRARHLRHVDAVRGGVGRGDAVGHGQRGAREAAPRGHDHGPVRIQRERGPGRGRDRGDGAPVRDGRGHQRPGRGAAAAGAGRRPDRPARPHREDPPRLLQGRGEDRGHLPRRSRRRALVGTR